MKLRNLLFIVLAAIVFCNCQSYQPTSLTVASYNLRNANGSDSARGDGWGQRYPVIAQIVLTLELTQLLAEKISYVYFILELAGAVVAIWV